MNGKRVVDQDVEFSDFGCYRKADGTLVSGKHGIRLDGDPHAISAAVRILHADEVA